MSCSRQQPLAKSEFYHCLHFANPSLSKRCSTKWCNSDTLSSSDGRHFYQCIHRICSFPTDKTPAWRRVPSLGSTSWRHREIADWLNNCKLQLDGFTRANILDSQVILIIAAGTRNNQKQEIARTKYPHEGSGSMILLHKQDGGGGGVW